MNVFIPHINLLSLSWRIFLRNMMPINQKRLDSILFHVSRSKYGGTQERIQSRNTPPPSPPPPPPPTHTHTPRRPRWLSQMRVRLVIRRSRFLFSPFSTTLIAIEIDYNICSSIILFSLPIQEGQLSVSGEYWLTA